MSIGLLRKGSFSFKHARQGEETDLLSPRLVDLSGIDAILYILKQKRVRQDGTLDRRLYCLQAQTGAGKSSLMIARLYKAFVFNRNRGTILCTQPRVLLAQMFAENLGYFDKDIVFRKTIGYITGVTSVKPSEPSNIIYCTTQILYNMIQKSEPMRFGSRYKIIVIDEAHDASVEMQITLRALKDFIAKHYRESWCPLVLITSATIYPPAFIKYFGGDDHHPLNVGFVSGRTNHPIEEHFIDESLTNRFTSELGAEKVIEALSLSDKPGDILVILKGQSEMLACQNHLILLLEKQSIPYFLATVTAALTAPPESARKLKRWLTIAQISSLSVSSRDPNYMLTKRKSLEGETRIYISTPVSEFGVDFPNLMHIIDGGWHFTQIPFPIYDRSSMVPLHISRNSQVQRKGRVGRRAPGHFWALYTREASDQLDQSDYPSTAISPNATTELLELIFTSAMEPFPNLSKDLIGISAIIALNRAKTILQPFDIINDPGLLHSYTLNASCIAFRELYKFGLIKKYGNLTDNGLQYALLSKDGIAASVLQAKLLRDMIHPVDIALFQEILSPMLIDLRIGSKLDEQSIVAKFYIEIPRWPPKNPEIFVFIGAQKILESMKIGGKADVVAEEYGVKYDVLIEIIERILLTPSNFARHVVPYIEADRGQREKIIDACRAALSEVMNLAQPSEIINDPKQHYLR